MENAPVSNKCATSPVHIGLPDGSSLIATQKATLPFPQVPTEARDAFIVKNMQKNLLSIGKLCDAGCTAIFKNEHVKILRNEKVILEGTRNPQNGLWEVPLQAETCNMTYMSRNTRDMIRFMHAALGSPAISTLNKAIKLGYFKSWPGLTVQNVNQHIKFNDAMTKGHLDRVRQHLRSTKAQSEDDVHQEQKQHCAFAMVEDIGKIYTDQTGAFPCLSSRGNRYVFILYHYDTNAILAEPIKNRTAGELVAAHDKLVQTLVQRGYSPTLHILDNEVSQTIKQYDTNNKIDYQLVPPNNHRRNIAERAIRTWKNHFVATLCTTNSKFPMHLWCRLIPQATMTLNMLRSCRHNIKLSAYEALDGAYSYDATPLAPPGCKVIAHETPAQRKTWAPHGVDGFYIGPTMDHYRCHKVYIPSTHGERIVETVDFQPTMCENPSVSNEENAIIAAHKLTQALQAPGTGKKLDLQTMDALKTLADIFHHQFGETTKSISPAPQRVSPPPNHVEGPSTPRVVEPMPAQTPPPPRVTASAPANSVHVIPPDDAQDEMYNPMQETHSPPDQAHRYPTRFQLSQQANAIVTESGEIFEYRHLIKDPRYKDVWEDSMCDELGRLTQGRTKTGLAGTDTMNFILFDNIPEDRRKDITYPRIVVDYRPQKEKPNRTRITVGGNRINYPYTVTTQTAELCTHKLLVNSVVSSVNAKYMTADIGNFYLGTPMQRKEYMFIPLHLIPPEMQEQYKLHDFQRDGKVYVEIQKGMYGLPQAGILANQQLRKNLQPHGYLPCPHTPGLWKHIWRPIKFTLVVDDFGVMYEGKEHVEHLLNVLHKYYPKITTDWDGALYCGIHMKWNPTYSTVQLSMPGYIQNLLHKYNHKQRKQQHAPHPYRAPVYGSKIQTATPEDATAPVDSPTKTRIQQIVGSLLYYSRAVDPTMLVALNSLSSQQANPTHATVQHLNQLLDYAATHPNATLEYTPSGMILKVHSDASYLSEPRAKSRYGGHFYLGSEPVRETTHNGPVHTTASVLKNVVSSASEAEYGGIFMNAKAALPLRQALLDLGHPQPPTPIQTDNDTATGLANETIKQKHSKTVDMRFHWIRDRIGQKQFQVYWRPGATNKADYFSKHHAPGHHHMVRSDYLKM